MPINRQNLKTQNSYLKVAKRETKQTLSKMSENRFKKDATVKGFIAIKQIAHSKKRTQQLTFPIPNTAIP